MTLGQQRDGILEVGVEFAAFELLIGFKVGLVREHIEEVQRFAVLAMDIVF